MNLKSAFAFAAIVMSASLTQPASAVLYDVNNTGGSATQAGAIAVDLNNINGVTFASAGGSTLLARDRGAGNTNGTGGDVANNELWRDFVFSDDRGVPGGASIPGVTGMDVTVNNLTPNQYYNVRLWAFDDSSNGGRNMTWNGHALGFPDSPDPTSLNDYDVRFLARTNDAGQLVLEGRAADPVGPCCNVFVNGFELTEGPFNFKIDIDTAPIETAPGFTSLPVTGNTGSVTVNDVTFTVFSADGARNRASSGDPLTADFIFDDGAGQASGVLVDGLPDGEWEVSIYSWDNDFAVGPQIVGITNFAAGPEMIITDNFLADPVQPFKFRFNTDDLLLRDGFGIFTRVNNTQNRSRFNAIELRQVVQVPEPATGLLALLGLAGLGARRRRKQV